MAAAGPAHADPLRSQLGSNTALARGISGALVTERGDKPPRTAPSSHLPRAGPDPAATPDLRRAYTVNEAARVLGISRSTIYKMIQIKTLKTIKACGRRLVTRDSIEELLAGDQ